MAQPRELKQSVGVEGGSVPTIRWPSARIAYRRLYRWVALTDELGVEFARLGGWWMRLAVHVPSDASILLWAATPIFGLGIFAAAPLCQAFRLAPAGECWRI